MSVNVGTIEAILSLKDQLSGGLDKARKGLDNFVKTNEQSISSLTKGFGILSGAITATGTAITAMGVHGAGIADVSRNFETLTKKINETSESMLTNLRKGTFGTISDFELMKVANRSLGAGLKISAADMGVVATAARELADRTGGDTAQAFETLNRALTSGRANMLRHLGVFVDQRKILGEYRQDLDETGEGITDVGRRAAMQEEILKALKNVLAEAGEQSADFGDKVTALHIRFTNFYDALSQRISESPALLAMLDAVGEALDKAFGDNQQQTINETMNLIEAFAITILDFGQNVISAVRFIGDAWDGLTWLFAKTGETIAATLGTALSAYASLASFAASTSLVNRDLYKQMAAEASAGAAAMKAASESFKKDADNALTDAARRNAALDATSDHLKNIRSAVINAAGATDKMSSSTTKLGKATSEAGEALESASAKAERLKNTFVSAIPGTERLLGLMRLFGKPIEEAKGGTWGPLGMVTDLGAAMSSYSQIFGKAFEPAIGGTYGALGMVGDMGEKLAAWAKVYGGKSGTQFGTEFKKSISNLGATIMSAITGGGNIGGAIGGSIFGSLGADLGAKLGTTIGGTIGKALGSALGPLGVLGGSWLGSKIGGFFSGLFGGDKEKKEVNKLRDQFIAAAGGIDALRAKAIEAGVSLDKIFSARKVKDFQAAVTELNTALDFQAQAQQKLQDAIERYGFSIEELGPKFRQQEMDKQFAQLIEDYSILIASGIQNDTVLMKMAESYNTVLNNALAAGIAIPEAMRAPLERMLELGLLVDEAGNKMTSLEGVTFTETLSEGLSRAVDGIDRLVAAIERLLGIGPIDIPINVDVRGGDGDWGPGPWGNKNSYQGGTHGQYVDFGAGTPAMLHNRERIVTEEEGRLESRPLSVTVPISLGSSKLGQILFEMSRSGHLRVSEGSVV